jgi:putative oxidoreductase
MEIIFWIGKILFGGFFVWNGIEHFTNIKNLTGYAKHKKIPAAREMVYLSGVLLLLGGFSIIFEKIVVLGILILIIFMVSVTFSAHRFWQVKEPTEKMNEKVAFMKNMALIGALIMLFMISIMR